MLQKIKTVLHIEKDIPGKARIFAAKIDKIYKYNVKQR